MTSVSSHVLPSGQDLDTAIAEGARAYELDRQHVFHSWSAQAQPGMFRSFSYRTQ